MKWNQVITIDAMEGVRGLPDGSIRTVVTSPPYFRQRDYGCAGQWGQMFWRGSLTRNKHPSGRRFESPLDIFYLSVLPAFIAAHGGGNGGLQLGVVVVLIAGGSFCCRLPLAFFAAVLGGFLPPFPCPGYGAGNDGRHFPIKMRAAGFRVPVPTEKKLHSGGRPARLREGICVLGRDRAPPPRHTSRPCCTGRPLRPAGGCSLNHLAPGRLGWGAATRGRHWSFSRSVAKANLL